MFSGSKIKQNCRKIISECNNLLRLMPANTKMFLYRVETFLRRNGTIALSQMSAGILWLHPVPQTIAVKSLQTVRFNFAHLLLLSGIV